MWSKLTVASARTAKADRMQKPIAKTDLLRMHTFRTMSRVYYNDYSEGKSMTIWAIILSSLRDLSLARSARVAGEHCG